MLAAHLIIGFAVFSRETQKKWRTRGVNAAYCSQPGRLSFLPNQSGHGLITDRLLDSILQTRSKLVLNRTRDFQRFQILKGLMLEVGCVGLREKNDITRRRFFFGCSCRSVVKVP